MFSTAAEAHDNIPSHETLPANLSSSAISTYGLQNDQAGDLLRSPLGFAPSNSLLTQAEQNGSAVPSHPSVIPPHPLGINAAQAKQPAAAGPLVEVRVNPNAPARLPYGHWDNQAGDWSRDRFGFARAFGTPAEAEQNLPASGTGELVMPGSIGSSVGGAISSDQRNGDQAQMRYYIDDYDEHASAGSKRQQSGVAQIEARAIQNGAQPGQIYEVVNTKGQVVYRFKISGGRPANSGWALGLGIADQFAAGAGSKDRYYGSSSTQALNMKKSRGYQDMLQQIAAGKKSGSVGTNRAVLNTVRQPRNGTQAQLGAFTWSFSDPKDTSKGIDIYNDVTPNSLFYHIPEHLPAISMPSADPDLLPDIPPIRLLTQWPIGPFATIHQKIHLNYP